jgi:oligoendopeptidase F
MLFSVRIAVLATAVILAVSAELTVAAGKAPGEGRNYWDLTDLYPTPAAWENAYSEVDARAGKLPSLRGTVGDSAGGMLAAMTEISNTYRQAARLYVYAQLSFDEDQRLPEGQARFGKARALLATIGQSTSWLSPEIIAVGEAKVSEYLAQEKGLSKFEFQLRDALRMAPHTLSAEGEAIMAKASLFSGSPEQIYNMYANASIEWPAITLADGTEVKLNQAAYTQYRSAPDRDDRKAVFDAFFGAWTVFGNGMGATLNAEVQANVFQASARHFDSALQQNMFDDSIPEEIVDTLVEQVNAALPVFYRYLNLRRRMLNLDKLAYYDIYVPLIEADTGVFDLELSKQITLNALQPFGQTYVSLLQEGFSQDWMHSHPQDGKDSGAYVSGYAYDVHPYVLLNHNDDYESLTTFAHEWGHAVHTMLSVRNNPWETFAYSTFVAEMASTINQILLEEYMIANAETREQKLLYLGAALESLRGTVFRQTMFTEFERTIHAASEQGQPLTGNSFSEVYLDLLEKYHGQAEGVMEIDPLYGIEWAYIPHFYRDFYVYQYATSMSGAVWFANRILEGDTGTRDAFIRVLSAGGSDYPHSILLKEAGLDLRKPDAYRAAFARMENLMDRIEELLDQGQLN